MSTNYFMSDAFVLNAVKSVREAIAKADALGLPKAYGLAPKSSEGPAIVRIVGKIARAPLVKDAAQQWP